MSQDEQVFCTCSNPCFISSFVMLEEPDEKHTAGSTELHYCSLQWVLALWFRTSRVVVPAQEGNELFVFQVHPPWATQPPVGSPTAPWESLFSRLSVSQVSGALGMADSQESLPNTLHRSNKRVCFASEWHILTSLPILTLYNILHW